MLHEHLLKLHITGYISVHRSLKHKTTHLLTVHILPSVVKIVKLISIVHGTIWTFSSTVLSNLAHA